MIIHAGAALLETGWAAGTRIAVEDGRIRSIETGVGAVPGDERHEIVVPGLDNLHSHAFQRAMAGLAEVRGPASDSFWSWRKAMYGVALAFEPEQLEAVATHLYVEMLEAGFTRVGEFHYLHHDREGRAYGDIAELAGSIASASMAAGISLTLLPVFYAHSGFGGMGPAEEQRRFINSVDGFSKLVDGCRMLISRLPGGQLGIAPHSLRAATPCELAEILPLAGAGPVHIHIAEQAREVDDCLAWSGRRPVEWLLDNAPVDERWTLVHATHMTEVETAGMAGRGAVAGLCPITEANLGDGVFSAPLFLDRGGGFGVGSDSNVLVSACQELRQLEYSQRLFTGSRNVVADPGQSTGLRLFDEAVRGGSGSLRGTGHLRVGRDADFVSLNVSAAPWLAPEAVLDQWVFGSGVGIDAVWVRGRKRVENGRHVERERVASGFAKAMGALLARLP